MAKRATISPFDRAYEGVLNYILAHDLSQGDRLPSERELCVELDVSRTTLRSALSQLEELNVVECRPGAGSFVRPPHPVLRLDDLSGFTEIVNKIGKTAQSRVVGSGVVPCPPSVAPRLMISPDAHVYMVVRLRGVEGRAVCLETSFVAADDCPGIEDINFATESLTETLRSRYGKDTVHTSLTVSVSRARKDEAAELGISEGALVFFEQGIKLNAEMLPVEYYEVVYAPERVGVVCDTVYKRPVGRRATSQGRGVA